MSEENKNITEQKQQIQGWKDVQLTSSMPVDALVQFLNILNQRLVAIEDRVMIDGPDGQPISLTKAYEIQTKAEMDRQAAEAAKQDGEKKGN